MGIAAVVGTVASGVIGGVAQSSAASKAAKAQENASNNAIAAQQGYFNTTQQGLQPYIDTGTAAGQKISGLEGLNGGNSSTIQATLQGLPGYQFALQQGLKSTQNSATARGLGESGAALKGASAYSTGLANEYYNNLLSGLQTTQQTGENAAVGLGSAATATGQGVASSDIYAGNAAANASLSQGAAIANGASSIPTGILTGQLLQNYNNQGAGANNSYVSAAAAGVPDAPFSTAAQGIQF